MRLGHVVEGKEQVLRSCCCGKGRWPSFCCWRRRVGAQNLWFGVLSLTTHPQQYWEFQSRQSRNRWYWSVRVLIGSCRFESFLEQHVPNSTWSSWIRILKTSIAVVHESSLGSGWSIFLFTLSLGRIGFWQEGTNSVGSGEWFQGLTEKREQERHIRMWIMDMLRGKRSELTENKALWCEG